MAHTRSIDSDAPITKQCARMRRIRNVAKVPLIAAQARTNMTDPNHVLGTAIKNTSEVVGMFVAPCKAEVVRCYANAGTFATCASGGTVTVKATKGVIGDTDVDLCSTITVSGESGSVPTAETAIDGTLSTTTGALDLVEGQLVYATLAVSNHDITDRTEHLAFCVEWIPKD